MADYSLRLDAAEVARYREMSARALEREADLWDAAGIAPNADVVDLGCGPGVFLPTLAERTAPRGRVVGVDASEGAVSAARSLAEELALGSRVEIVQGRCEATGLEEGSFDAILIRNVLIHNGPRVGDILAHARGLLRPGGHVLAVELDATGTEFPQDAPEERELEERWVEWGYSVGNNPAIGPVLADAIREAGFTVSATQARIDELFVERSPTWTARQALLDGGFATEADIARWEHAINTRLAKVGNLAVRLHVFAAVGHLPGDV